MKSILPPSPTCLFSFSMSAWSLPRSESNDLCRFMLAVGLLLALVSPAVAQTPEDALLHAPNTQDFGWSVSIDGDRAIVGDLRQDGPSGDPDVGAAYIFERTASGTWKEVQVLRGSNSDGEDQFGDAVSIDGNRAIVGARYKEAPSGRTNGLRVGAAYIFERDANGNWQEVQVLRASDGGDNDQFGESVSIDGERALVGADSKDDTGAAYIFERSAGGTWQKKQVLYASNAENNDDFGEPVSIDGKRAIVGASREDGPSNTIEQAGAAYVFERTSSGWPKHEHRILRASNADSKDSFGSSVSISEGRAIVGAYREDGPSNTIEQAGAAYVFERTSSGWPKHEHRILRASNADSKDAFGSSASINGGRAIVGAYREDGSSNTIDQAGAAYVFERNATSWQKNEYRILRASNAKSTDFFGSSVSISGNRSIVGAWNGNAPSGTVPKGAAYVNDDLSAPRVADDRFKSHGETTFPILENDDPGLGTLDPSSVQIETPPTNGMTSVNADGTITYTPDAEFSGEDTFSYTVANQNGARSSEGKVTVTVFPKRYGPGHALIFDGTDDNVTLPNAPAINTGSSYETRTIELWFTAADVSSSTEQVLYEEGGIGNGFNLYLKDGTLYAGAWSERVNWNGQWLSTTQVQSDTWHHVALVFDEPGGTLRAYLDGTSFGDETPGGTMARHEGEIGIGVGRAGTKFADTGDAPNTGFYLNGRIDQLRLWNNALTRPQIRARAKRTINLQSTAADHLIAAYRFNAGLGTTVFDYSTSDGTAQHGSFFGDPQWAGFSGARFGKTSTVLTNGSVGLGPTGGTVTVENVSTSGTDALQIYRYGSNEGPVIGASNPAEDFSGVSVDGRINVVWGLNAVGSSPSADVTFDFHSVSGVQNPNDVVLLKRKGPGDAWTDVTSNWMLDAQNETVSKEDVSSFSQYAIGGTEQALPVEFTMVEEIRTNEGARLEWTTTSETGNAEFRIQRRATSNSWTTIGRREGAGTTSEPQTYRFTDARLPYAADSLSYRLKQVDTDGTVHFSDPVTITREGIQQVQLTKTYPNPASEQVTVRFAVPEETNGETRVTLYDVLGRRVRTVVAESVQGRAQRVMDVSGLSSGVYVVRLQAGDTVETQRLTVVR